MKSTRERVLGMPILCQAKTDQIKLDDKDRISANFIAAIIQRATIPPGRQHSAAVCFRISHRRFDIGGIVWTIPIFSFLKI